VIHDQLTKWDERFLGLAREARSWVKGPDLGVGACVVSPDRRGFSLGYSGLPRGIDDTEMRITSQEFKDHNMVHAELNAILNAGRNLTDWTMYATTCPCSQCAAAIIQAGISRVVSPAPQRGSRWYGSQLEGAEMLREASKLIVRS
jgi:dCMP deaminase